MTRGPWKLLVDNNRKKNLFALFTTFSLFLKRNSAIDVWICVFGTFYYEKVAIELLLPNQKTRLKCKASSISLYSSNATRTRCCLFLRVFFKASFLLYWGLLMVTDTCIYATKVQTSALYKPLLKKWNQFIRFVTGGQEKKPVLINTSGSYLAG